MPLTFLLDILKVEKRLAFLRIIKKLRSCLKIFERVF